MDIVPHRRIAAVKAALVSNAIINPLDRVTSFLRRTEIIGQDLVDEADMPIKLRMSWLHGMAITRWR